MQSAGPAVVVSLDAELRWGFHDFEEPSGSRVSSARDAWLDLLEVFEEFGDPEPPAAVVDAELRLSREAAADYGLELSSFVFPRNRVGHRELLAEHGFTCYRGPAPDRWYDGTALRPAGKLATFALDAAAPPIVTPEVDEYGLVDVHASMYLFEFEGGPRDALQAVSRDPVVRQVELGLRRLHKDREGILHPWLHPNNVTTSRDLERMREVAALLARYRDRDGVAIGTMASVADRVLADREAGVRGRGN